jgi:hypothetical protein
VCNSAQHLRHGRLQEHDLIGVAIGIVFEDAGATAAVQLAFVGDAEVEAEAEVDTSVTSVEAGSTCPFITVKEGAANEVFVARSVAVTANVFDIEERTGVGTSNFVTKMSV